MVTDPEPRSDARGALLAHLAEACADDSLVRLLLSGATRDDGIERLIARRVDLKGVPHLSFTLRAARRDTTRNLPVAEALAWLDDELGAWRTAVLETARRTWQLGTSKSGRARLVAHRPRTAVVPPREHDHAARTILDARAFDWLAALGITDDAGRTRPGTGRKRQQITRFVELLDPLLRDAGLVEPGGTPTLVDVGCGRGPLTFAAWHLLRRVHGVAARVVGVEARAELVADANALAARLGADGLGFAGGDIGTVDLPPTGALVALHACDTATDHAIRRGVECGASLIVVAPCCHQELRPQLRAAAPFDLVLRHGLMAERLAEWLTDALRTLTLEWAGYRTRTIEFVGAEHTPKNLLIAAVREPARAPFADAARRGAIDALRATFGVASTALDALGR